MNPHELALVHFVRPERRARWRAVLQVPNKREKLIAMLPHRRDLDERWMLPVPPQQQSVEDICRLLLGRGAPDRCWAISEHKALDNSAVPLDAALRMVVGTGLGTLLSCLAGVLAYYEGEDQGQRVILHRPGRRLA